jgi:peroxiredoxin
MALTPSNMLPLGTKAPNFKLPDAVTEKELGLDELKSDKATVIMFICNHCPYVKHILKRFVALAKEYQQKGVAVFAINCNDFITYPDDAPVKMEKMVKRLGFTFPYLYDETQEVAKAYKAACTPDFYLFDKEKRLVYHGQMDGSWPGNRIPVTGKALQAALDAILNNEPIDQDQRPSIGSDIKWKRNNKPDYAL